VTATRNIETVYDATVSNWVEEAQSNPCALYCRAQGTEIVEKIAAKVLDGTRCYQHSYDVCVDGECQVWLNVAKFNGMFRK